MLSARGTRLNSRGRATRQQLLRSAVYCLAEGGPEAVSANAVVKHAGVTWGTVQHQFGDVDGLWSALLEYVAERRSLTVDRLPAHDDVGDRVAAVVDLLWAALQLPGSVAIYKLRASLPRQRDQLEDAFPRTAQAIAHWDSDWTTICHQAFAGLGVDPDRLIRVRNLLPGAIRGIYNEQDLSTYIDASEARRGLVDAITAYLRG